MLETMLTFEAMLFVFGFVYALAAGNKDMAWWKRALAGGAFFALFYVAFPVALYLDRRD
jgi:hypothetical protein